MTFLPGNIQNLGRFKETTFWSKFCGPIYNSHRIANTLPCKNSYLAISFEKSPNSPPFNNKKEARNDCIRQNYDKYSVHTQLVQSCKSEVVGLGKCTAQHFLFSCHRACTASHFHMSSNRLQHLYWRQSFRFSHCPRLLEHSLPRRRVATHAQTEQ